MLSYNRPEKLSADNSTFNFHVSRVRIRSEHCVGFLKGRFCSLRGLRLQLSNSRHVQFATYWIIACIALHNFALEHELNGNIEMDEFFQEGQEALQIDRDGQELDVEGDADGDAGADARDLDLLRGRLKREELKQKLFDHIAH